MEEGQKNTAIWYTIGALILIVIAYMVFFKSPTETVAPVNENATTTNQAKANNTSGEILINDQFSTSTATVDKVVVSSSAWVVIHEDRNGKPGNILGASWVPMGETLNLEVELLRAAIEGQTYYAMIHADDGTGGASFDLKTDLPLTDVEGNPIMKAYKIIFDKG